MSDSVRPHRRPPTRHFCPWDSPGKNTGVGCHFLLQCMKVKSESEVPQSCPTLSDPHGMWPSRLLRPWDFPDKSIGVGCHCLLQRNTLGMPKIKGGRRAHQVIWRSALTSDFSHSVQERGWTLDLLRQVPEVQQRKSKYKICWYKANSVIKWGRCRAQKFQEVQVRSHLL